MAILILLGDALHNFIGGLGIASTFLLNPAAGVAAFVAAAAHEVPLVHLFRLDDREPSAAQLATAGESGGSS